MGKFIYISLEEALEIHKTSIENNGGGDDGELDIGKLDSVLTHIQNDDYYPTFLDKMENISYHVDILVRSCLDEYWKQF